MHIYVHMYVYINIYSTYGDRSMFFGYSRMVLCCAGAYVSGAAGSNVCPAGSARIATAAECRTAAAAAGKTVGSTFVQSDPTFPRGCYFYSTTNAAYFHTHAVGAGYSTQLLGAALADTTGAPPPHAADARARVSTGARVCRHCACTVRCV